MNILKVITHLYMLNEKEGAMTTLYTALMDYNELLPGGFYERN